MSGGRLLFTMAILLWSPTQALAMPASPTPVRVFREFTKHTAPGLPQSTVMDLYQDSEGLLWIATLDGLGTFDGVDVRGIERQAHAPSFGPQFSIAPRSAGGIIVGGNEKISIYDGTQWNSLDAPGNSYFVNEDETGGLWRIASDQLLRLANPLAPKVDASSWQTVTPSHDIGAHVALHRHGDGSLWLAGRDGVLRWHDDYWAVRGPPPPAPITTALPTADGYFIGTATGEVYSLGDEGWRPHSIADWTGGWIRTLAKDRRGRVWAGGNSGSVAVGDPGSADPWSVWSVEQGLHRGGIMKILPDRDGALWFALNGRGLQQWVGEAWSHRNLWSDERLDPRVQVFGITATDDGFLAAVFGRGVWRWDGERMRQIAEQGFQDTRYALEIDDRLWIGGRFGAWESVSGGPFRPIIELTSGFVWGFEQSPDGDWYAISSIGVHRREPSGRWRSAEEINQHLPSQVVRALRWRGDEVWVGTMGGLAVLRADQPIAFDAEAFPEAVNALADVNGDMWVAGFGGITIWRGSEFGRALDRAADEADASANHDLIFRLSELDGLPGRTIYALAEDDQGGIWLGGSAGVGYRAPNPTTPTGASDEPRAQWRVWNSTSGLLDEEINHQGLWPAPDGSIYAGTMGSMARFDPDLEPLPTPPLSISWLRRPGPADDGTVPSLGSYERNLRLEWRAPCLAPQPVEYRWRVPRQQAEWSEPGLQRHLFLSDLDSGRWHVEVQARRSGSEYWSPTATTIFDVEPFWWERRGLQALATLLAVLLIAGLIRWRTSLLRARARQLERSLEEEMARIKVLSGLLPICSVCKSVRDDDGYWQQIERYIDEHSEAVFSHGLCPHCAVELYPELEESDDLGSPRLRP